MTSSELLQEFEMKFYQLAALERVILDLRKTKLFLQAADDVLEDKLSILLADKSEEGGFTADWKKVEDAVLILIKQRHGRVGGRLVSRTETQTTTLLTIPVTPLSITDKTDPLLDELIKGIRDLKVELIEHKRKEGFNQ